VHTRRLVITLDCRLLSLHDQADPLLERHRELAEIDRALERARAGVSSLLVVEGDAGEGKSALLAHAHARANGTEIVAFDDAHRLDRAGLEAVRAGERARGGRAPGEVIVVTFRPAEPDADEAALDELRTTFGAVRFRLRPLSLAAVSELVRSREPTAGDELCAAVHAATAGNPLYVDELLAGDPRRSVVPAIGDRALRRAASLGPDGPRLLAAMAVLGDGERLAEGAQVAGLSEDRALEFAHRLRRMGLLAAEDPFSFAQPIVRRSVRAALPDGRRTAAHAAAAAALEQAGAPAQRVAEHLAALVPAGAASVASGLIRAADAAGESLDAIRWLRRALDEGAEEPPRADLLYRLGMVELIARDPAAIGHLREMIELTTDPARRVPTALALAEMLAYAGQWEDAMGLIRRIDPDLEHGPVQLRAQAASILAVTTAHDAARVHIFDAERPRFEELSRGTSWSARALAALLASAGAQRGEPAERVLALAERSLQGGNLLAEQSGGGWAAPQLLGAYVVVDAVERALAVTAEVDAAARSAGSPTGEMIAAAYRGWIACRCGDLVNGEADLRQALAMADESFQMMSATAFFFLTDALLERPGLGDIAASVRAMTMEPAFMSTWSGAMMLWPRGLVRLIERDRAGAVEDLRAVGRIATALRTAPSMAPWRSALALALPDSGRDEAVALVQEELAVARASGLPRPEGVALRAAGLLAGGEEGIELLRAAVDVLERSPARLELARALVELGGALRRGGRRQLARGPLEAGLDLAVGGGALRLAARARDELAAAAGRPPRDATSGRVLTASELRIARLAIAGASNPEIARTLFVSLKTVETHLSHVYSKLGLSGRGARERLAAALVPHEAPDRTNV
jgi:DNA-binding CsgD family transcriptional regulator